MLRPSVRYYSQHKADFFDDQFPPDNFLVDFYSADQRLGTYGSLTLGAKVEHAVSDTLTIDLGIHHMEQRTEWSLQGGKGSNFQALRAIFYGVGIYKKF